MVPAIDPSRKMAIFAPGPLGVEPDAVRSEQSATASPRLSASRIRKSIFFIGMNYVKLLYGPKANPSGQLFNPCMNAFYRLVFSQKRTKLGRAAGR